MLTAPTSSTRAHMHSFCHLPGLALDPQNLLAPKVELGARSEPQLGTSAPLLLRRQQGHLTFVIGQKAFEEF